MGYRRYQIKPVKKFCEECFVQLGFKRSDAIKITDVLLAADLFGIESHGVQRLALYYNNIKHGMVNVNSKPEIVFETPVTAVIDGHDGMGQLIGCTAMEIAIDKAKVNGVGIVVVRESNHYGIASYYARMAVKNNLIGFSCTNSQAIMIPTNGRMPMIGSNPIACSMGADPKDFIFDAATTVVTRGKLEVYNKAGNEFCNVWALNKEGLPETNPKTVLDSINNKEGGGIMPLGGNIEMTGSHKGYGFGMLCEIFSSVLSLGKTSNYCINGSKGGVCHGFTAINPSFFGCIESITEHFSTYLQELRESPKADGCDRIYTHGEKENEAMLYNMDNGIRINDKTIVEFCEIGRELGVTLNF